MRRPHCCPLCSDFAVETTLQDYAVTANVKGEKREVNALSAFQCRNGHIFFLCQRDLIPDSVPENFTNHVRSRSAS
jgi:hypothetical protein